MNSTGCNSTSKRKWAGDDEPNALPGSEGDLPQTAALTQRSSKFCGSNTNCLVSSLIYWVSASAGKHCGVFHVPVSHNHIRVGGRRRTSKTHTLLCGEFSSFVYVRVWLYSDSRMNIWNCLLLTQPIGPPRSIWSILIGSGLSRVSSG